MKNAFYVVLGLLVMIIELSVTNKFPFMGVTADLFILYVMILSLETDAKTNFIVVVILGFIKDILLGTVLGINIAAFVVTTFVVRFAKDKIYDKRIIYPLIMMITATIIQSTVFGVSSMMFFNGLAFDTFLTVAGSKIVLNGIICLMVYAPLRNLFSKI